MELKIKLIRHQGVTVSPPRRSTEGSAGYDLFAAIQEPLSVEPGALVKVPTGVAIALPGPDVVGLVYARSGLAVKHGIALSNGVGVIDSDYRGEIVAGLCNLSEVPYLIHPGERIAQLVIAPVLLPELVVTDELDETGRAQGGFGSTGRF